MSAAFVPGQKVIWRRKGYTDCTAVVESVPHPGVIVLSIRVRSKAGKVWKIKRIAKPGQLEVVG